MDEDLNVSGSEAVIFEFMHDINKLMASNKLSRKILLDVIMMMD